MTTLNTTPAASAVIDSTATRNPLSEASREWANRPDDERFTLLAGPGSLQERVEAAYRNSKATVVSTRRIEARPTDERGLVVVGPNGQPVAPTNWAFGQLAQRAGAPAGYLRALPSPLAADCINFGLKDRAIEDVGVLLRKDESGVARINAVTGPSYGRVWNRDIVRALVDRFGNGRDGHFRVPGEFGERVEVTKANTTLFASDRDMFVFLADEDHRIELPGRRAGKMGTFARGFFVWNSEVGSATFGVKSFFFDYTCCNRNVWGPEEVKEFRIRHTASAPERWVHEVAPALEAYANSSTKSLVAAIEQARAHKLTGGLANENAVQEFLAKRFTRSEAKAIEAAHLAEEDRPIETLWDVSVGATAYAKSLRHQDERVRVETIAGSLLPRVHA